MSLSSLWTTRIICEPQTVALVTDCCLLQVMKNKSTPGYVFAPVCDIFYVVVYVCGDNYMYALPI